MMFGQLKGPGHVGKPWKIWNNVVLSDMHRSSLEVYGDCLTSVCPYHDQHKTVYS